MSSLSWDNTENTWDNTWEHQYLAKPKTIAGGGLGGSANHPGGSGQCLGSKGVGVKPPNNFVCVKHAKTGVVRVNIG